MRIAITKQPKHLKEASYALFAAGTVGDVWVDDETAEPRKSLGKAPAGPQFDA